MRLTYLTFDDVNRYLMRRWARQEGFAVNCPRAGGPETLGEAPAALVVDFDYLPGSLRGAWLTHVLGGRSAAAVLAHGHSLSDAEAAALMQRGARVCRRQLSRRLVRGWIRRLQRAAQPPRPARPLARRSLITRNGPAPVAR